MYMHIEYQCKDHPLIAKDAQSFATFYKVCLEKQENQSMQPSHYIALQEKSLEIDCDLSHGV